LEQLEQALALRPKYVAFGPVYATRSKVNPDPVVGPEGLRAAWLLAARAGIPLVAIGGITLDSAFEVAPHASAVAVITGLLHDHEANPVEADSPSSFDSDSITARARAFQRIFGGGASEADAAPSEAAALA
jgi:thiamine-phosphate pyrophosphorylase